MGLWSRLKRTFRDEKYSAEIREELQFHLDMHAASEPGHQTDRLRLADPERVEEETRAAGIVVWLHSTLQDVRYGMRQLRTNPTLSIAVVFSLAIGLGANTAIFNLFDAAVLEPLPVRDPDSLRIIEWLHDGFPEGATTISGSARRTPDGGLRGSSVAASSYRRLASEQTSFDALIGMSDPATVAVATGSSPAEQLTLQYVSGNFFEGLGVVLPLGRSFLDDEDRAGQPPAVVVSHRYWRSRLRRDGDALGDTIRINGVAATIVGVAPSGFFGSEPGRWIDLYAPLGLKSSLDPADEVHPVNDQYWWVHQVGRLQASVSEAMAREQLAGLFQNLVAEGGSETSGESLPTLVMSAGRRGLDALDRRDVTALWILMLLVAVLLLIVCANVANLLLSRAVGRRRDSAVRLALGAPRTRLFQQHLIESGILALLGAAVGLALGSAMTHAIHGPFQTGRDAGSAFALGLDLRVLAYTAGLATLTTLLFGLAPAIRAARSDLSDALKAQSRSVAIGTLRLPRLLVSLQFALCLAALISAGLLGRSLGNLTRIELGIDVDGLSYATVDPWSAGLSGERVGPYLDAVRSELEGLPGVDSVAPLNIRALEGRANLGPVNVRGRDAATDTTDLLDMTDAAYTHRMGDGAFETLAIPLRAGRTLLPRDFYSSATTAVVDERFVEHFFDGQSPIGHRIGFGTNDNDYEIVGVVRDSRWVRLRENERPMVFLPYIPSDARTPTHFAVRSSMETTQLAESVRRAVASVDPSVPLAEFHTQKSLIERLLRTERLLAFLSGGFGLFAMALAAVGLSGLIAYNVARRTNEIGIRIALGARSVDVTRMILRDCFWMLAAGIGIGISCAWALGKLLEPTLFGLEPADPATAAVSLSALLAIAFIAAWLPARRAARISPMTALREE